MTLITLKNLIVRFYTNGPMKFEGDTRHTCGGCVLIPKTMTDNPVHAVATAQRAAKVEAFGSNSDKWPCFRPDRHALRDGDCEDWDGFEGHWYLSFRVNHTLETAPEGPKPSLAMAEGVFKFIAGDFAGMQVRCEPVRILEA